MMKIFTLLKRLFAKHSIIPGKKYRFYCEYTAQVYDVTVIKVRMGIVKAYELDSNGNRIHWTIYPELLEELQ